MDGQAEPRRYSHAERLRVVQGVMLCMLLAALDQTVVLPAIPQMAQSLHGQTHLSWVVSAYLLASTATTPLYGKLSDQFGRAKVLGPALVAFVLTSLFCAMAWSVPALLLGRALQGLAGGALITVSQAAVADAVPPRERGRYQAYFASMWALASGAGPVVGGWLAQNLSWRYIFWVNLPLGLCALALCIRGLKDLPINGRRGRFDLSGAGLLIGASTLLLLAISLGGVDLRWLSWPEAGLVLAGLLGLLALRVQQRRSPHPLMPSGLLIRLRGTIALAALNNFALFGAIFMFPLLLQRFFHDKPAQAGIELVPFLLTGVAGAYTAGQIARRTGKLRAMFVTGTSLASTAFLVMTLNPLFAPVPVSALIGFGVGMLQPTTILAVQALTDLPEIGIATGMLLLLRAIGGVFGATLAGAALDGGFADPVSGYRLGFGLCLAMALGGLALSWRMHEITLHSGP